MTRKGLHSEDDPVLDWYNKPRPVKGGSASLKTKTVAELQRLAKSYDISGRSQLRTKAELVNAVKSAAQRVGK